MEMPYMCADALEETPNRAAVRCRSRYARRATACSSGGAIWKGNRLPMRGMRQKILRVIAVWCGSGRPSRPRDCLRRPSSPCVRREGAVDIETTLLQVVR